LTAALGTVLANLAYLIGAVVVAVVIGVLVWLRHRKPKSVDANMASFRRGLSALAPDPHPAGPSRPPAPEPGRVRPVAAGLTHVRLDPRQADPAGDAPEGDSTG
jgi:hypothetical protein